MSAKPPPRILSIAGSDSSGGAGIQADIKTITVLGGYAMTARTAITAQDTTGVSNVQVLPAEIVLAQIDACLDDIGADAIKIGMIGSAETARKIAQRLDSFTGAIDFDPVMVATSGAALADEETIAAFGELMDIASVVTPNLPELAALSDADVRTSEEIIDAALALAQQYVVYVLAKGGHGTEAEVYDRIVSPTGKAASFGHARLDTPHTHGTGCTLSSALATLLAHGQPMTSAIKLARGFTFAAIENAPGFGRGNGPLGHGAVRKLD